MKTRSRPPRGGPEPKAQSEEYHGVRIGTTFPLVFSGNLALAGKEEGRPCGRPTAGGIAETPATASIAQRRKHHTAFRAGGGCRSLAPPRGAVVPVAPGLPPSTTAPRGGAWPAHSRPRPSRLTSPRHAPSPRTLTAHVLAALASSRHTPEPSPLAIRFDLRSHATRGNDWG